MELTTFPLGFPGGVGVKNPPANAGDAGDSGSIPGSGRSPGVRKGNPLQHSYLENPMDRGAWRAAGHGVAKSQTPLSTHTLTFLPESPPTVNVLRLETVLACVPFPVVPD